MSESKSIQLTPTQMQILSTLSARIRSTETELSRHNEHFSTSIILVLDAYGFEHPIADYTISVENDKLVLTPKTQD